MLANQIKIPNQASIRLSEAAINTVILERAEDTPGQVGIGEELQNTSVVEVSRNDILGSLCVPTGIFAITDRQGCLSYYFVRKCKGVQCINICRIIGFSNGRI